MRLTKAKAHYFGASVDRCHLPRKLGGRGINSFVNMHEIALVRTAKYLDEQSDLTEVRLHQERIMSGGGWSVYREASEILKKYAVDTSAPLSVIKDLQIDERSSNRLVHGAFWKELSRPGRSTIDSVAWLKEVKYSAASEAFIFAMQDGVILTRGYRKRICKSRIDDRCRNGCAKRETVSHILTPVDLHAHSLACLYSQKLQVPPSYNPHLSPGWLPFHISSRFYLQLPLTLHHVSLCRERSCIPCMMLTEAMVTNRRPDIVVFDKRNKIIEILEIACTLDHLLEERERERNGLNIMPLRLTYSEAI